MDTIAPSLNGAESRRAPSTLIIAGAGAILIVPLGHRRGSGRVVQTPAQLDAAVSAWPAIAERLLRAWARVRRAA